MTDDETKPLTKRQVEFLAMSGRGMTYDAIAHEYVLSINTVRSTLTKARRRIGASTNAQAIVLAIAREEIGLTHEGITYVPDKEV